MMVGIGARPAVLSVPGRDVFLGSRGTNRTTVQIVCFSLTADLSAGIALIPRRGVIAA